jgi:hypothetical protein
VNGFDDWGVDKFSASISSSRIRPSSTSTTPTPILHLCPSLNAFHRHSIVQIYRTNKEKMCPFKAVPECTCSQCNPPPFVCVECLDEFSSANIRDEHQSLCLLVNSREFSQVINVQHVTMVDVATSRRNAGATIGAF